MLISDWSSDVCSADLLRLERGDAGVDGPKPRFVRSHPEGIFDKRALLELPGNPNKRAPPRIVVKAGECRPNLGRRGMQDCFIFFCEHASLPGRRSCGGRSEEHTSELQSLMRISYAVFCLK